MENIIGYIHICQVGDWKRSLNMLLDPLYKSGLYEKTTEIRIGLLYNNEIPENHDIFNNSKIKIIYNGKPSEYERPTLLHMRSSSFTDNNDTKYWYIHTKGLRHFNGPAEGFVLDWIKLLLFWNIEKHELAIESLKTNDIYGCNWCGNHYSGNYWWARSSYIQRLPDKIPDWYVAPEMWIAWGHPIMHNIFSSGLQGMGHYSAPYPETNYRHL
jgi:hypothetical protein